MTPEQQLIDQACTRLCFEYARAVDFRDYDNLAELFTEDGELDVGSPLRGRDAILGAMMRRPDELRSRHVISNVLIEPLSADVARGTAYLTLYRHHGEESLTRDPITFTSPAAVGHYEDRYQRTPDGWRFARRKLFLAFRNPALWP